MRHFWLRRGLVDRSSGQAGEEGVETAGLADLLDCSNFVVEFGLAGEHFADRVLFGLDVVGAHQRCRVPESGVRFMLALDQAGEDSDVAGEPLGRGCQQERRDLRPVRCP